MTAVLVIVILVLLIVVHECGHFLAAKFFGVKVLEFGVGYPPRAVRIGSWGGTEYTLNWIPFGGFVRLFGDDGDKDHGPGSFVDAPRWKQAIILIAGVTMNFLVAWLLFSAAYMIGILHPVTEPTAGSQLIVSDVVAGSPADVAGIHVGDQFLTIADAASDVRVEKPTPENVMEFVSARGGQVLEVTYVHNGETMTAPVRPAHAVVASEAGRPAIGIGLVTVTNTSVPFPESFVRGWQQTYGTLVLSIRGMGQIFGDLFRGESALEQVTGPIGLVSYVAEASRSGWGYVFALAAFISVNLTVINLIPIPALDGGKLLIVTIEAMMRRRAPRLAVQFLNTLGVALIIMLMIAVTYQDIARLIA